MINKCFQHRGVHQSLGKVSGTWNCDAGDVDIRKIPFLYQRFSINFCHKVKGEAIFVQDK